MRDIKFRGKRLSDDKWIYGSLISPLSDFGGFGRTSFIVSDLQAMPSTYCLDEVASEVITETVGQFTGLKDKNGHDIYEGDSVKQHRKDNCFGREDFYEMDVIEPPEYEELGDKLSGGADGSYPIISLEIIGNIHDNPELLDNNDE